MIGNVWNNIIEWFTDRISRNKLVRSFNIAAREHFVSGYAPTLLKAEISIGDSSYKHQHSDWLCSGFRIKAFSGKQLDRSELKIIGQVVLSNSSLARTLIVLGWDTLEVHGDEGRFGLKWQLKDHMLLE